MITYKLLYTPDKTTIIHFYYHPLLLRKLTMF